MNTFRPLPDRVIDSVATPRGATRIRMDGVRKRALDVGRNRLLVTGAVVMLAFGSVCARLVDLTLSDRSTDPTVETIDPIDRPVVSRADVVDRNGFVMATNLPISSLYADPSKVLDPEEAATKLVSVLPELDRRVLFERLTSDRRFVWLKRGLTPEEKYEVNRLGIPGVAFRREETRIYPHGSLTAHVIGYTDTDNNGIAGIEREFNKTLEGSSKPLRLSIDIRVQSIMRDELQKAIGEFQGIGGAGIVADVRTGEIIAMVSLPDFDPNVVGSASGNAEFNRATKGVYEMGSTFKLLNVAIGLNTGVVKIDGGYDASKPIHIARFTITDFHPQNRWLSVPEIITHSSNIASAKMAVDIGVDRQREYMKRFGMLDPAKIELPEIGTPLYPHPWREINAMTISFGHGIAVSPLQLVTAVSALVNGGVMRTPTLLAQKPGVERPGKRVISVKTSELLRGLMRVNVTRGSGKKAQAAGYMVGGKTGTAEKLGPHGYLRNKQISSFIAAFPIQAPRYVVFAMVDEPKGNKSTFGYATGGWVAAPIIGHVIDEMGPLLGIPPSPPVDESHSLIAEAARFVKPGERDGASQ